MPSVLDKRYCEIGFSAAVTPVRADLSGLGDSGGSDTLGGPGGGAHGVLTERQRVWPGRHLGITAGDVGEGMLRWGMQQWEFREERS